MGTLKINWDQMGTKKLILVPMGTKVPKWGPTWEQWLSPPPPHPNNPAPSPFHCLPVNPGYFGRTSWLSWFSRKKSRGRTGQETTLKQPRKLIFQSWNQIFGQVTRQWAWPTGTTQKESTSSAIYCKITISFGEILIFTSTFLGGFFFCKFSNQDFLLFHNGIITLHCLGRWQIYRRGYFSFQNSSMTKNDSTVSIFSELTPQKSRFC